MNTSVSPTRTQSKGLRLVLFDSGEDFMNGLNLFLEGGELSGIFYKVRPVSIIVSEKVIPLLVKKGLKFRVLKSIIEANLTPRQHKDIEHNKALLIKCGEMMFFEKHMSSGRSL